MCVVTCIAIEKLRSVNMVLEAALNLNRAGLLGYLHHSLLCLYSLALQLSLYCANSLRLCGGRVTLELHCTWLCCEPHVPPLHSTVEEADETVLTLNSFLATDL